MTGENCRHRSGVTDRQRTVGTYSTVTLLDRTDRSVGLAHMIS